MKPSTCFDFGAGEKLTITKLRLDYEDVKPPRDGAVEFSLATVCLTLSSVFLYIGLIAIISFFTDNKPLFILFFGTLFGSFGALGFYQFPAMARLWFKSQITLNGENLEIKISECWPLNIRTGRTFNYPARECVLSFTCSYINKRDEHNFHIELTHTPSGKNYIITSTIQPSNLDPASRSGLRNLVNEIREAIVKSDITLRCKSSDD